jgi:AmiR/NasT family two-component response regulator
MKSLRILVVDDESIIRMDLREMLVELGHEVVGEAGTGEEALELAEQLDAELLFLDLKMPGMGGMEVLRRMAESHPRPVIVLTAFSERTIMEEAIELGARAYIVKPFQAATVVPAIHLAMAHFEELRALRDENASLKDAVAASKLMSRAKGLLAEREGLTEREAFRRIQKMSMDHNKKMKDVAEAVILLYETG